MNKMIITMLFASLVVACSEEKSNTFSSGLPTTELINQSSATAISYQVNQVAIDEHSSLALLGELKGFEESSVPASWPHPELGKLRRLFQYLHKEEVSSEISKVIMKHDGRPRLIFSLENGEEEIVFINKTVSKLSWVNATDDVVTMKKNGNGSWLINVGQESLSWNARQNLLCLEEECVEI